MNESRLKVLHIPRNDNIMKCKFTIHFARRFSGKYQVMSGGRRRGGAAYAGVMIVAISDVNKR
jgi:hypothetical protein